MSNAYMIRLELLKMAQSALDTEYHTKVDMVRNNYQNEVAFAHPDKILPTVPTLPPIYSMEDIVAKAQILNDFVSKQ